MGSRGSYNPCSMADLFKILRNYLLLGLLSIACIAVYRLKETYSWMTVPEHDSLMAPLLAPGSIFRIDCRAVDVPLERGAVVAYLKDVKEPDAFLLGRIVGLPGERVAVNNGTVMLDGKPLSEPGRASPTLGMVPEMLVPRGHYFILVDERNDERFRQQDNSTPLDSRGFGPVPACRMIGRLAR